MSWLLGTPGWLVGSVSMAAIVMVAGAPLLGSTRMHRRVATLPGPSQTPGPFSVPGGRDGGGRDGGGRGGVGRAGGGRRQRIRLACVAVLTAGAAVVSPPLAVGVAGFAWLWPSWRATAARRRHEQAVLRELPEVVDLFLVAVASGLNLRLSIEAVGERGPRLFGAALRQMSVDVSEGIRIADAIEAGLAPLGDHARPLATALLGSARYGMALMTAFERLVIETRQLRRRQAEETIRRVPVKLLFPLVLLVLPAFVLLTVVPLLASALRSLPF